MTDTAAATEASVEFVPPAPDAAAELDASSPQAAARALPDVEHLGVLRRAVLDALVDNETPLTVAQILAHMPVGTSRNTCESAIKRNFDSGLIERTAPGVYRLAPPPPPKPAPAPAPKPAPSPESPPARGDDAADQQRADALEADRQRKRQQRQRDAAARQAAADVALLRQLIDAAGGNVIRGFGIEDLAPIRLALTLTPIDYVLLALRKFDPKLNLPTPPPLRTWRDPVLLQRVAQYYCRFVAIPSMVKAWGEAKAPGKPANASSASPAVEAPAETETAPTPSPAAPADNLGELGGQVDVPRAQSGEGDGAVKPPDETAAVATRLAADEKDGVDIADAIGRVQSTTIVNEGDGDDPSEASAAARAAQPDELKPVAEGRASVLAAFQRNRTSSQPATPQPPRPAERPWFAGAKTPAREAGPEPITDEVWDEFCVGFHYGTLKWNRHRLGPEPLEPGCRVPQHVLRRNGLL